MQTLVFAAVLAVATAATIPIQEPLLTALALPVYGFYHEENDTTPTPTEQVDHQPIDTTTITQPDDEQLTTVDSQTPPPQPDETLENQVISSQAPESDNVQESLLAEKAEPAKEDAVISSQAPQSDNVQESLLAEKAEPAKEDAVISSQAPESDNVQESLLAEQAEPLKEDAVISSQAPQSDSVQESPLAEQAEPLKEDAVTSSQASQSDNVQDSLLAEQAEPVKEDAVISSQVPQSNNVQDSTPSPQGISETTSAKSLEPLNLPSGANFMLGAISTTFSCLDRPYGYYADPDNNCHVFHVCNPSYFPDGSVRTYQYSFMCGEGTVFDQKEMTCVAEWAATPCVEASSFYLRNQVFGQVQDKSP